MRWSSLPIPRLVAAVLLPPLAVYLDEGLSRNFWFALGLTCLGLVPGMIFAFVLFLRTHRDGPAPA